MTNRKTTEKLLKKQAELYPCLAPKDAFKFIYQSSFGCEHLAADVDRAEEYIRRERRGEMTDDAEIEKLDGAYSRVPLSYLGRGLSERTLARIFCLSARSEPNGSFDLQSKLDVLRNLTERGEMPFVPSELSAELLEWEREGYRPIHHSERFRALYRPAYRVVSDEYVRLLPLLISLDKMLEKGRVTLAVEGGSASGKTTLSGILSTLYECNIFHIDDFFLPPKMRTADRLREVGGNFDRERFLGEVLLPHSRGEKVAYRRYDCSTQTVLSPTLAEPRSLTVIEGAYSMHPALSDYYDLSVFLEISPEEQRKRIEKRNTPSIAARYFAEWIPLETRYFEQMSVRDRCDICLSLP